MDERIFEKLRKCSFFFSKIFLFHKACVLNNFYRLLIDYHVAVFSRCLKEIPKTCTNGIRKLPTTHLSLLHLQENFDPLFDEKKSRNAKTTRMNMEESSINNSLHLLESILLRLNIPPETLLSGYKLLIIVNHYIKKSSL